MLLQPGANSAFACARRLRGVLWHEEKNTFEMEQERDKL